MRKQLIVAILVLLPTLAPATSLRIGMSDTNRVALSFENGGFGGSLAPLYQCAFDNSGFAYEVSFFPQVRVLHLLERGEIDIGLPLAKLPNRDRYAIFTRPLFVTRFHLFTREQIDLDGDLSNYTFVVLRASASARLAASRSASVEEVGSWIQALDLARLGRFDGALIPAPIMADIGGDELDGLRRYDFGSIPVSTYVSRQVENSAAIAARLNRAIETCTVATEQ